MAAYEAGLALCMLYRAINPHNRKWKGDNNARQVVNELLDKTTYLMYAVYPQTACIKDVLLSQVHHLRDVMRRAQDGHQDHVLYSLSRHLHSTMEISFTDQTTDTRDALCHNLFALIRAEYKGLRSLDDLDLSVGKLCEWHSALFAGVGGVADKQIGQVRTRPTKGRLRPSMVGGMVSLLCTLVNHAAKGLRPHESDEDMLLTFNLAAFAQYHLADIHPFLVGNGLVCRYVAKHILEAALPLPIPMYNNKDDYTHALSSGVIQESAISAPLPTLRLLISATIDFYTNLCSRSTGILFVVSNRTELAEQLQQRHGTVVDLENAQTLLRSMKVGDTQPLPLESGQMAQLTRSPSFEMSNV